MAAAARAYEPNPSYPPAGEAVRCGWQVAAAALPATSTVLALDGPAFLDWNGAVGGLTDALAERGLPVHPVDLTGSFLPWETILYRTESMELAADPDFATICECALADLLDLPESVPRGDGVTVVFGPGAALVRHDLLWYLDLPKRYAEAAVHAGTGRNLGRPAWAGPATARRLFFVDWPVLDRHRDRIAARIDCWVDTQSGPRLLSGDSLRKTAAELAGRPFRTRPYFNTTPWGGHWAQRVLGVNTDAVNTALGYELIAPENGVLIGEPDGPQIEVPFQLIVSLLPEQVLGAAVHARFGTSFPIRFDYLDTVDGGNLSVHCHPRHEYMRRIFGWPYTQHESYYVMVGGKDSKVFLGLRADVDLDRFQQQAWAAVRFGRPFDVTEHVQTFPADEHQLFLIPAGTPHASGVGNLVLEISATPYLYSLRFYDWLRRDAAGTARPVHVGHAFANLDTARRGTAVATDLVPRPRTVRAGPGWREELLCDLPEIFYQVRRFVLGGDRPVVDDDTAGRFHVINVVDGDGVEVATAAGYRHPLAYAETMLLPAAVGPYILKRLGDRPVQVVKCLVR